MEGLPASVAQRLQAVTYSARAVAYLQVDENLVLVSAGGDLQNYGLATVRMGKPALDEAFFLLGLLPLLETPNYVPAVELAGGRVADLHLHSEGDSVWVMLLDVTTERDAARRVQQNAYKMTLLQEQEALLNRRLEVANAALLVSQRELEASRADLLCTHEKLQRELAEAASYVRSLLPAPMAEPFVADWRFVPSAALGGDAFGYHWIDANHFAMYLLDVCGHGVGPCLLSIAVLHLLQAGALRDVDFRDPGQVLAALNDTYQMKSNDDLYFTLWYGVYQPISRRLDFGCAGHPPAVLVDPSAGAVQPLKAKGLPIGMMPGVRYANEWLIVPQQRYLYLVSDGAFEVERPDGTMMSFDEFLSMIAGPASSDSSDLDRLYKTLTTNRGSEALEDDFSIVRFAL
jgi:sigma-B regulation protein RsbU (phosphoserine phosphatase)